MKVLITACQMLLLTVMKFQIVFAGEMEDAGTIEMILAGGDYEMVAHMGDIFLKKYPASEKVPAVLFMMADAEETFEKKSALLGRVVSDYGSTEWAARAHMEMGEIALLHGDYASAAKEFSLAAGRYEGSQISVRARYLSSLALLYAGDHERARAGFEAVAAVAGERERIDAEIGIADSFFLAGEHRKAVGLFRGLLDMDLHDKRRAHVMLNLPYSLKLLGKDDEGQGVLERITKEHPASLEAHVAAGLNNYKYGIIGPEQRGRSYLQVGVYSEIDGASEYKESMESLGLDAMIIPGDVYKVVLGPFGDDVEAQIYGENLKKEHAIDAFVIRY
jgi:tetratricopeptide (TPR) repeat protein